MSDTPTSVKRFTRKITVQKCYPPAKRPIGMSTEEPHLKFVPTALALRKTFQHSEHSYASTDNSQPAVRLCPSCNFQTRGSLKDHQKHHEKNFGFQCPLCSYSVIEGEELDFHLTNHHNGIPIVSEDEAEGESDDKLDQVSPAQKMERSSKRVLRCDLCLYWSFREELLEKHRQLHVTKWIYQCNRCSFSVSAPQGLSYHMRYHHSKDDQVVSDTISGKVCIPLDHHGNEEVMKPADFLLKCEGCNFSTSNIDKMKFHQSRHSSNYRFKCPLCSYSYFLKNMVKHHVKHHHRKDTTCPPPKPEEISRTITNDPVSDLPPIDEPGNLVKESSAVCPLLPEPKQDDAPPIELGNLSEEEKSCHGNDVNPTLPELVEKNHYGNDAVFRSPESEEAFEILPASDDMELDSPPIESKNLVQEETMSLREEENKAECPLPEPEFAATITPLDDLAIQPGNVDEEERDHGNEVITPSPQPKEVTESISTTDDLELDPTPIEPRNLDEEEKSCRVQLAQQEEALQTDGRSLENSSNQLMELEEKTQSLRKRLETAKKDEQIKEKMLKDLLLTKKEVGEQKKEMTIKKMKLEFELRTEQCKALELDLIEPDAVEGDHQERVASAQKKVKSLEEGAKEIEKELAQLAQQEEAIKGDLVDAEECFVRASKSLSAVRTELEEIESVWKLEADSKNQLVDSLKENIQVYRELVEQLLEIELEKKKENLIKEKANLLMYLETQFDDSNVES